MADVARLTRENQLQMQMLYAETSARLFLGKSESIQAPEEYAKLLEDAVFAPPPELPFGTTWPSASGSIFPGGEDVAGGDESGIRAEEGEEGGGDGGGSGGGSGEERGSGAVEGEEPLESYDISGPGWKFWRKKTDAEREKKRGEIEFLEGAVERDREAFREKNAAANDVYEDIRNKGGDTNRPEYVTAVKGLETIYSRLKSNAKRIKSSTQASKSQKRKASDALSDVSGDIEKHRAALKDMERRTSSNEASAIGAEPESEYENEEDQNSFDKDYFKDGEVRNFIERIGNTWAEAIYMVPQHSKVVSVDISELKDAEKKRRMIIELATSMMKYRDRNLLQITRTPKSITKLVVILPSDMYTNPPTTITEKLLTNITFVYMTRVVNDDKTEEYHYRPATLNYDPLLTIENNNAEKYATLYDNNTDTKIFKAKRLWPYIIVDAPHPELYGQPSKLYYVFVKKWW